MTRLSSRCDRAWSDLAGTGPRRYCDRCDRVVHDLDALPPRARAELLARGAALCVRFVAVAALTTAVPARADDPRPGEGPLPVFAEEQMGALFVSPLLDVVQARSDELRKLYSRHLRRRPGLAGKLVVRFAIEDGAVTDATVQRSELGDADFEQAVLDWFRTLSFTRTPGKIWVHYPLSFVAPKKRERTRHSVE